MHLQALLEPWLLEFELPTVPIRDLADDSREVQLGDVFVALAGHQVDGQRFINDAIAKGAQAVLCEAQAEPSLSHHHNTPIIALPGLAQQLGHIASRFYNYPSRDLHMIGVTGTNGKTSVSQFIAQCCSQLGKPCGVIGTLGWGFPGKLKPNLHTTPPAITLHRELAELKVQGATVVAMEVSSHALDQGRHIGVEFDTAVFTNLSRDHLDYHPTMAAYKAAKFKLFELPSIKTAIINVDDPVGQELTTKMTTLVPGSSVVTPRTHVIAYGMNKMATLEPGTSVVILEDLQLSSAGFFGRLASPWGTGDLQCKLMGQFNAANVLATIAVLGELGLPLPDMLASVKTLASVPGRMQTLRAVHQPLAVIDYAHTPDALKQVLTALRQHCQGQLWCVFGCGGDRDRGKRPLMGQVAEQYSDHVIITNDNPRSESPPTIIAAVKSGLSNPGAAIVQLDRRDAILSTLSAAGSADVVLIAGKGHEDYQIIGEHTVHFSDQEVIKEFFKQC